LTAEEFMRGEALLKYDVSKANRRTIDLAYLESRANHTGEEKGGFTSD
jgi:hypothetical protein